ncbi:hypothetical protein QJR52_02765 [Clostridium baratii]|uniref:coiled-coil domain-containing protein n=1 Tax=Clostridium baratii TaxID=1561 RepID=UPI0030CB3731
MKINFIKIQDGIFNKQYEFKEEFNLIYSKKNSCGKTTLLRMLMYGLGFSIPSTKGIAFSQFNIELEIELKSKVFNLIREDSIITLKYEKNKEIFILPSDQYKLHKIIFGIENELVLKNILGVFYVDQEKGWTLLNRGISIGSNRFNIEEFIRGVSGRECYEEEILLKNIEAKISKYKQMLSMASYQKEIEGLEEKRNKLNKYKDLNTELEVLKIEKKPIQEELKRLEKIIKENANFKNYIENMKLVVCENGVKIPVNEKTLIGFYDNKEYILAKRKIIVARLLKLDRKIENIKQKLEEKDLVSDMTSLIEMFDYEVAKLDINFNQVESIIESLQKQKHIIRNKIRDRTRKNNNKIDEIHKIVYKYSLELGLDKKYIKANKDYIFTNDLKSLSGAVLHKIVFSFKLAYISLIKSSFGITLPIILDSPSGKEVDQNNIKIMLDILVRDFREHQIIIASIYKYNIADIKLIEIKEKVLE